VTAKFFILLIPVLFLLGSLSGCGTAQKQRLEQRDKLAAATGMYCEFISGDVHNDIDVELNLQLAKRCDPLKPFTMTNYKNSSENYGVIYCCSMTKREDKKEDKKSDAHSAPAIHEEHVRDDEKLDEDPVATDKAPDKVSPLNKTANPAANKAAVPPTNKQAVTGASNAGVSPAKATTAPKASPSATSTTASTAGGSQSTNTPAANNTSTTAAKPAAPQAPAKPVEKPVQPYTNDILGD
jgi:hypothetical protein